MNYLGNEPSETVGTVKPSDWREIARKWEHRANNWRDIAELTREALLADEVEFGLAILEAQLLEAGVELKR